MRRDLVVIGASAGGIDALRVIVGNLPADFAASMMVVIHTAPDSPGVLGPILARAGQLSAVTVARAERLRPGTIYVPCPDRHLIVEPGLVRATHGPRENRFRPAIDPLFRSAAQAYGPRVIGVILTGGLDDGTAGLWAVKQLGGIAVVQDPDEALVDSLPRNALLHVKVDHKVTLDEIAPLLVKLTRQDISAEGGYIVPEPIKIEVDIAKATGGLDSGVQSLGRPSQYACPECHGVLRQLDEGERIRFRCHTGHAYSSDSLMAEFDQAIETSLWSSIRALQEKAMLMRQLAQNAEAHEDEPLARRLQEHAAQAIRRADHLRQATLTPADDPDALKSSSNP